MPKIGFFLVKITQIIVKHGRFSIAFLAFVHQKTMGSTGKRFFKYQEFLQNVDILQKFFEIW